MRRLSGVVCYLLGIREPEQLRHHPLRGAVFETWVVSELYKARVHAGLEPDLFHFRASRGPEVDLVEDSGSDLGAVEIKSGTTVTRDFFKGLELFEDLVSGVGAPARDEEARDLWRRSRQRAARLRSRPVAFNAR